MRSLGTRVGVSCLGCRASGLGCRAWGLGLRIEVFARNLGPVLAQDFSAIGIIQACRVVRIKNHFETYPSKTGPGLNLVVRSCGAEAKAIT